MKRALAVVLALLIAPAGRAAEEEHGPYLVANVRTASNGDVFLNIGAAFPNQTMTVFIPAASASQFSPETFRMKRIMVLGKIGEYKGKPEIVVKRPAQIRVLE